MAQTHEEKADCPACCCSIKGVTDHALWGRRGGTLSLLSPSSLSFLSLLATSNPKPCRVIEALPTNDFTLQVPLTPREREIERDRTRERDRVREKEGEREREREKERERETDRLTEA